MNGQSSDFGVEVPVTALDDSVHVLRQPPPGADEESVKRFYAPLGCVTSAGRLYRLKQRFVTDEIEMWQVEVCFFDAEGGLSGWALSGVRMGPGWFVPVSSEVLAALDAYMNARKPTAGVRQSLGYARSRLEGLKKRKARRLEDDTGDDLGWLDEQLAPLQNTIADNLAQLEGLEMSRRVAQVTLLEVLGWDALAEECREKEARDADAGQPG